jgi:hypothetical protein
MSKISQEVENIYIVHPDVEEVVCIHKSALPRYKKDGWTLRQETAPVAKKKTVVKK